MRELERRDRERDREMREREMREMLEMRERYVREMQERERAAQQGEPFPLSLFGGR
jgi:hypothetical protein